MPWSKANVVSVLRWLLLLSIPALWCLFDQSGALGSAEEKTVDWRFQWRGEVKPPLKVVYADIDSLSLDEIGNFPWNREYFATVASALVNVAKVKAVGFDIVFSDTGIAESADLRKIVDGNIKFGRFLSQEPPVVLGAEYSGWQFLDILHHKRQRVLPLVDHPVSTGLAIDTPEVPAFETSPDPDKPVFWTPPFVGLIDTIDNGTRIVPAYVPTGVRPYFHLSLELARLYWGLPVGSIKVGRDAITFARPGGPVVARVPLRYHQMLEVNWFTRWNSLYTSHIEFSTLYKYAAAAASDDPAERAAGRKFFSDPGFKDAVVLVGPVDPLLQDLAPTSLDAHSVPRVGVHGNLLMTIVSGRYLRHVPGAVRDGLVFVLSLVMAGFAVMGGARAVFAKVMALLTAAFYVVLAFYLFNRSQLILPLVAPVGAAFSTSFAGLIWQVVEEQKAKGRIKGMFGTYLAPTVVEQMIESGKDPELGGHDSEITAYFSDIQSFSSFSEVLPSSKLGELLNEYLTACTDIVQSETGTLDKYIGDAVVAMFGAPVDAPDHAYRACFAAQRVQHRIGELREKWRSEGDKWPQLVHHLRTRIGLNTGVCMIGNMGSRTRFNYTMMGDNVNLAARMESGAKSWGVYTMCTESTRVACEQHRPGALVFRALGRIVVKGRSQPVPIHEIVGLRENVSDRTREGIGVFEQALARYYTRDWDGALALFARSRDLEANQPDKASGIAGNPSLIYLTKVVPETRAETLPPDWDGRYIMHEK
ncbi:MAG TPA: adenylate/guanylate cyclase domain-containing protein [Opitutaceae bacterium]|nr:adenylate/guanylate cyclase domain-containing protein [Opitutaceae bacterium]